MFQALPSRQDMAKYFDDRLETYASRIEVFVKKESVQENVAKMADKLSKLEAEVASMGEKVEKMDDASKDQQSQIMGLAFKMMDLENRGRRNNIRLRGVPESIRGDTLWETVTSILNAYLDRPAQEKIELDRVHRARAPEAGVWDTREM